MRTQGIFAPPTGHCMRTEPHKLQFLGALHYPPSPWGALKKKTSMEYAAELSPRRNFIDLFSCRVAGEYK